MSRAITLLPDISTATESLGHLAETADDAVGNIAGLVDELPSLTPRTAMDAATLLLADMQHVHYVSDGHTECLNRACPSDNGLLDGLA